jgi:hypothetical protein
LHAAASVAPRQTLDLIDGNQVEIVLDGLFQTGRCDGEFDRIL